jgi:hypothetical protein
MSAQAALFGVDAAAVQEPGRLRWFVRCEDCLSVSALADPPPVTHNGYGRGGCGACGGRLESMGQVFRDLARGGLRLQDRYRDSACDFRCTGARGPSCDCKCLGRNHGSHRTRTVVRDRGPVPLVVPVEAEHARARAEVFRAAFREAEEAWESRYAAIIARRSAVSWLSPAEFEEFRAARRWQRAIGEARARRTDARVSVLRDLADRMRKGER